VNTGQDRTGKRQESDSDRTGQESDSDREESELGEVERIVPVPYFGNETTMPDCEPYGPPKTPVPLLHTAPM